MPRLLSQLQRHRRAPHDPCRASHSSTHTECMTPAANGPIVSAAAVGGLICTKNSTVKPCRLLTQQDRAESLLRMWRSNRRVSVMSLKSPRAQNQKRRVNCNFESHMLIYSGQNTAWFACNTKILYTVPSRIGTARLDFVCLAVREPPAWA